jgi:hypothetical protein
MARTLMMMMMMIMVAAMTTTVTLFKHKIFNSLLGLWFQWEKTGCQIFSEFCMHGNIEVLQYLC